MFQFLCRFLTASLIIGQLIVITPWQIVLAAETNPQADIGHHDGTESEPGYTPGQSLGGKITTGEKLAAMMSFYADPSKLQLDAVDEDYINHWLEVSHAIEQLDETQPGVLQTYLSSGKVPQSIIEDYNLDTDPIPPFDAPMMDIIATLLADHDAEVSPGAYGDDHEFMEISRLIKDFDSDEKSQAKEGVSKPEYGDDAQETISAHSINKAQAFDVSQLDYIRCTKIATDSNGNIVQKDKLDAIPIEFKWQIEGNERNPFNPDFGPNVLNQFGVSLDDLLRRGISQDNLLNALVTILKNGDFPISLADILPRGESTGSAGRIDPKDLVDLVGEGLLRQVMGGSRSQNLVLETDLRQTAQDLGRAILQQSVFPKAPPNSLQGETIDEVGANLAALVLGNRLLGSGSYRFEGENPFPGLASQYISGKILGLRPTNQLIENLGQNPTEINRLIGKIAAAQRLNLDWDVIARGDRQELTDANGVGSRFADPALVDDRLHLINGTTADFVAGHKSADQYFELIGIASASATSDAYADDSSLRDEVEGLAITFTPDTLYLPNLETYPVIPDRLKEIERFYKDGPINFFTDAGWNDFTRFYTDIYTPRFNLRDPQRIPQINLGVTATNEEKEARVRSVLAGTMADRTAYLARFRAGQLTPADWSKLGQRVMAKSLANDPFEELALTAYLESNGQTLWQIPVSDSDNMSGTNHEMPVINPDRLAENKLGFLDGDLDLVLKNQYEIALGQRFARDLLAEATGNRPANNGSVNGLSRKPFWTDQTIEAAIQDLENNLPNTPATSSLRAYLTGLSKDNWKINLQTKQQGYYDQQRLLRDIQGTIGQQLLAVKSTFDTDTWNNLAASLAGFVAGRPLTEYHQLIAPAKFATDQRLNLTEETVRNFLSGSPNQVAEELGAAALVADIWNSRQPKAMTADLISAFAGDSQEGYQKFFRDYQETFNNIGTRLTRKLDLRGDITVTGQQVWSLFQGNRLPLFDAASKAIFQSLTGTKGTLANGSPSELNQLVGLRKLLSSGGYGGQISLGENLGRSLAQTVFEQRQGLKIAETAQDFLLKNGPYLLRSVKAPEGVVSQLAAIWDYDQPEQALELLKQPGFWENIPVGDVFRQRFGNGTGAALAANFVSIFTTGLNPQTLVTAVGTTIDQFFPRTIQFDWSAVGRGDNSAILNGFSRLGSQYFGKKFQAFTELGSVFASRDSSPRAILNWSMSHLPTLIGQKNLPEGIALGVNLASYFIDKNGSRENLTRLIGEFGQKINLPILGDAATLVSNPRQFATSLLVNIVAKNLNQAFDQNFLALARQNFRGLNLDEKLNIANQLVNKIDQVLTGVVDPAAQNAIFKDLFVDETDTFLAEAVQDLTFANIDAVNNLSFGTSETMLTGQPEEQLKILFQEAGDYSIEDDGLSPALEEGLATLNFDKIAANFSPALDGVLSNMIGIQLPPNFSQNTLSLFQGKISQEQYQGTLGNFAIGQVSGFIDKQLGLPTGTSYIIYQSANRLNDAAALVSQFETAVSAQNAIVVAQQAHVAELQAIVDANPNNLDALNNLNQAENELAASQETLNNSYAELDGATQNLANIGGNLAGMAVSLVFGESFSEFDQSLGLPSGTTAFIVSTIVSYAVTTLLAGGIFSMSGVMTAFATAFPMFAVGLAVAALLDIFDIFGGDDPPPAVICSPAGYYPFITKEDEARELNIPIEEVMGIFDPDPQPDKYYPCDPKEKACQESHQRPYLKANDSRVGRREISDRLNLSSGFPGEFYGEETDPLAFQLGKKTAARWKIRELVGDVLLMPQKFGQVVPNNSNKIYQPSQVILYPIPENDISSQTDLLRDGDYLLPYSSDGIKHDLDQSLDAANDTLFQRPNLIDGSIIGLLDWYYDRGGYGTEQADSMEELHQKFKGEYNRGVWTDESPRPSDEYRHHIHIGF